MRFASYALLALALGLFSCGGGKSTPEGKYKLEIDPALIAEMEAEVAKTPEEMRPMVQGMVDMLKNMDGQFELKGDNTFTASMKTPQGENTMKGTWKLAGDQITMTSTHQNGEEKEETKTGTFKDGQIVVEDEQGGKKIRMILKPE
jgi:hypothetical protein